MSGLNGPFLSDVDGDENEFTYCDNCCRKPMRGTSPYCSEACELEAFRITNDLCRECGDPLKMRTARETHCPSCRAQHAADAA